MCSWGLTSLGRPDYDLLLLWRCWNDSSLVLLFVDITELSVGESESSFD